MGKKEDKLNEVLRLRLELERVEAELRDAVAAARGNKTSWGDRWASWAEVGEMLGMTAGGAQKKYRDVVRPQRQRDRASKVVRTRDPEPVVHPELVRPAEKPEPRVPAIWQPVAGRSEEDDRLVREFDSWSESAALVRSAYGSTLTNDDCTKYSEELQSLLDVAGVVPGTTVWWDTEHADGTAHGVWADSWESAILHSVFSWKSAVVAITPRRSHS